MEEFFKENNFLSILIFLLMVSVSLLLSEYIKSKNKNKKEEVFGKVPYILIGIIFSFMPTFLTAKEIIISAIILLVGGWLSKYFNIFKSVFSVKKVGVGVWMVPFSLGVLSWIWLPEYKLPFIVGMLVLTFSEVIAEIVEKYWPRKKIGFLKKTYLGSLSFFLSTFIVILIFSRNFEWWKFAWISFILTLVDLLFIFGLNNIFVPVATSYLFYWFLY